MLEGRLLEHDFGAAGRVDCFKCSCASDVSNLCAESCLSVELCSLCACSVACFKCWKLSNVSISLLFQGCFIQHSFVAITHARVLFCIGMVTSGRLPARDSLVVSASCTRMGFGGTKPWPPDPLVDVASHNMRKKPNDV